MLVIHGDTNSESRRPFSDIEAALVYLGEQACLLDMACLAICAEARTSDLRVELTLREHQGLVGGARGFLPLDLAQGLARVYRLSVEVLDVYHLWIVEECYS